MITDLDSQNPMEPLCQLTGEPCPKDCYARQAAMSEFRAARDAGVPPKQALGEALKKQADCIVGAARRASRGNNTYVPCVGPVRNPSPKNS